MNGKFKNLWEYEKEIHCVSWNIVKRFLFEKWRNIFTSGFVAILFLFIMYFWNKNQFKDEFTAIIVSCVAFSLLMVIIYFVARCWAPVELKHKFLNEIEKLKCEKARLEKSIEPRLKIYFDEPENPYHLYTLHQAIESDEQGHYVGGYAITDRSNIKLENISSLETVEGVEVYMVI